MNTRKEGIRINKYSAIGEVKDGVTNKIDDIEIKQETRYSSHKKNIQDEEELVTPLCVIMFQNKRKLKRHMSGEHNDHGKPACKFVET